MSCDTIAHIKNTVPHSTPSASGTSTLNTATLRAEMLYVAASVVRLSIVSCAPWLQVTTSSAPVRQRDAPSDGQSCCECMRPCQAHDPTPPCGSLKACRTRDPWRRSPALHAVRARRRCWLAQLDGHGHQLGQYGRMVWEFSHYMGIRADLCARSCEWAEEVVHDP